MKPECRSYSERPPWSIGQVGRLACSSIATYLGSRGWGIRCQENVATVDARSAQQNGRHERMHLTLKQEATRPAGATYLQQQGKFDAFQQEFNQERPHEALG